MVFSAIPQVVTEDRASGAHIVDGSLKIDNDTNQYLRKAFSGLGNTRTFTWSCWVKRSSFGDWQRIFTCEPGSNLIGGLSFTGAVSGSSPIDAIRIQQQDTDGNNNHFHTNTAYRDTGWYHIVMRVDTTSGTPGDRLRLYVNGELQSGAYTQGAAPGQNSRFYFNRTNNYHEIGHSTQYNAYYDGQITQCYWIDGQSLGPENFGFTDSLTNTWRPKKYEQLGPNNGTTWSLGTTAGNIESARPWALGFDGREDTFTRPNSNQMASIMFDTPINFSSKFEIKGARDSGNTGSIEVYDGTDAWIDVSSSFGSYGQSYDYPRVDITSSITSPVKGIRFNGVSAVYQPRFTGIYVDDVILIDGDTSNMGGNGFYLPMDGNSPIGKDQSGRGNDFRPMVVGSTAALDKATGAIPILKTSGAAVRTDKKTYTVTEVGGKYHLDGVQQPILNAYRGSSLTFDYTSAGASHPLYLSSLPDGKHNSKAYSVSFDGSGDALRVADHADLRFGTGAFTIECYVWFNSFDDNYPSIISKYTGGTASWILRVRNNGAAVYYSAVGGGSNEQSSEGVISLGKWHHMAMVREGTGSNQAKMYVDGRLVVTATDSTDYTDTQEVTIGAQNASDSNVLNGYMSNVRIIKGTALYTSEFTPPGTTLTNVTNTKLLCCQDSDATTAAVIPPQGTITVAGNPSATQTKQPFLYDNNHGNFGVNAATSNTTKITIPHLAADTLYYYCQNHSGMGSSINVTTDTLKADPYAWKNVLALPLVDYNVDVSADFSVNSSKKAISIGGDPSGNNRSNFYGGSTYFDGNDTVRLSSTNIPKGSSARTIEFWVWIPSGYNSWSNIFSYGGSGDSQCFGININNSQNNNWAFTGYSSGDFNTGVQVAPYVNKWTHVAVTYAGGSGGALKIYLNGILVGSTTKSLNTTGSTFCIGGSEHSGFGENFTGYISDFRVYEGLVKYTDEFVPASTTPDVVPDTPSGVLSKANLVKITDGSVAVKKSANQYLQAPASADFRLNAQYCIEFFLNLDDYSNDGVYVRTFVLDGPTGDGGSTNIHLNVNPSNGQLLLWSGSGQQISPNAYTYVGGGWHHVCVTRDSSNRTRMFIDGTLGNWSDINTDYSLNSGQNRPRLGALGSNGGTTGHYSNFRIIKGSIPTEYQTSTSTNGTKVFDPPTEALTTTSQGATANDVKLIACQSNTEPGAAVVSPNISGSINTGTQWSKYLIGAGGFQGSYPATNAFNGVLTGADTSRSLHNQVTQTFRPPSGIPYSSSVEVWTWYTGNVSLNGGSNVAVADDQDWRTIASGSGTIDNIRFITNAGNSMYLAGIRVDGTVLLDPLTPSDSPTANTFNPFNDDIKTIRGEESNYATLSNLIKGSNATISDCGLKVVSGSSSAGSERMAYSNIAVPSSGSYYAEVTTGATNSMVGICRDDSLAFTNIPGCIPNSYAYYENGNKYLGDCNAQGYGDSFTNGDTIGISLSKGTLTFYKNGISQGAAVSGLNGNYHFGFGSYNNTLFWNFGQKPFKYSVPVGHQPLSYNTIQPEKVIGRPDQYEKVTIWDGNNNTRDFDIGMKPDLVWIKCRNSSAGHRMFDTVRGVRNSLKTDSPDAQDTVSQFGYVSSFNNNGFTLTPGTYSGYESGDVNMTGRTYVGWTWKAGGNSNTFNIDNVGYANASDVGMNAGGQNSNAYDQSQTWSTYGSGSSFNPAITTLFDNDLTTGPSTPAGSTASWTFKNSITASKSIEIYCSNGSGTAGSQTNGTQIRLTVDGVVCGIDGSPGWIDTGLTGNLTEITIHVTSGSGSSGLRAIRVDGKELVDAGVSVPNVPSVPNTGCSVGTKQGFSIVAYNATGSNLTVSHGLSERPGLIILKSKNASGDWLVWHQSLSGVDRFVKFNDNMAQAQASNVFLSVDEHTFGTGNDAGINSDTQQKIAYIWHDVPGLQKFGKYEGNTTTPAFIELGFRPALIWIKSIDQSWYWNIHDSKRSPINPSLGNFLRPDSNAGDGSTSGHNNIDFLSNGFKIRSTTSNSEPTNVNGQTYIYCAWAEAPAVNLYGAQANAR